MMRKALFLFFFSIGLVSQAQDSEPKLVSGISWGYIIPQENLDVVYDHGFAFIGNFDYRFNKNLIGRFDIGWNDLSGPETQYIDTAGVVHTNHPNRSILEITAGLRAAYSYFYVEARGGYFTGINEWGVVPAVGVRIKKFDIQGSYTLTEDHNWATIRASYYFGEGKK